ncbi:MAG: PEP-CTERM sorting domain-containing protein [Desulfobulbaceae bacterium]|nr:PEP-CTERM sorting domain-containing protein [Desulfobulbaceae bacterium]
MKTCKACTLTFLILAFGCQNVSATQIDLFDWGFNIDGAYFYKPYMGTVDNTGFISETGLGTLTWQTSEFGAHTFLAVFDHDIETSVNSFFNESGSAYGTAEAGQTWEIDEPGYWAIYDGDKTGDIHSHLLGGDLDKTIFNDDENITQDDVSMGMGWHFSLDDFETAVITLTLSESAPNSGFYLEQHDDLSGISIYLSSTLVITSDEPGPGPTNPIPEPGTMLLFGTGLAGLTGYSRKKSARTKKKIP